MSLTEPTATEPPARSELSPEQPEPPPRALRERPAERVVTIRLRSVLSAIGVVLGVAVAVGFVVLAQHALTLIAIALFFALALNPAVQFFQRRGLPRGWAIGAVSAAALVVLALLAFALVPPLVKEISRFIEGLPTLLSEITKGHGPLGSLDRKYHVVDQARKLSTGGGVAKLGDAAAPALSVASGVVGTMLGAVVIAFLTLFMLAEGPAWRERFLTVLPPAQRPRWERVGAGIYTSVSGFVLGNLLASLLGGLVVLVIALVAGLPYPLPLALLVTVLELIPFLGPVLTTVVLALVGLTQGLLTTVLVVAVLLVYHAVEGHTLRPMIYGRAVQLSALTVLVALLVGIELAGVLGALAAIPVAGAIQVLLLELRFDDRRVPAGDSEVPASSG